MLNELWRLELLRLRHPWQYTVGSYRFLFHHPLFLVPLVILLAFGLYRNLSSR
jgi:hypothetical protein